MLTENAPSKLAETAPHFIFNSPWRHPSTFGQSPELWVHGEPFLDILQPRCLGEGSRGVGSALGTKPERLGRSYSGEALDL